jgi:glutamate-1-semialdehyde 2,1-aminomutase
MINLEKSNQYKERAKKVYPGITGTFSRAPTSFVEGVFPVYAESANGARFKDVDGNEFLDFVCGFGPISLGYNYPQVNNAIIEQLNKGILFSLPHSREVELAELLCKIIPNAEMAKFEKSGSNAVTGAVRAARAITKKEKIAYCGTGGVWHDWQAAMVSLDAGVPEFNKKLIKIFDYNDAEGLEQIFDDNRDEMAAIVIEPTQFEKPQNNFLQKVRKIASENNAILILDEIVTGFRFDIGGGQKYFDIKGDIVCFGKALGNGLPISAITGPTEFMKIFEKVWVSSTNNMENLSIAGTIATINEIISKNTIKHCWEIGSRFFEGWNKITKDIGLNAKIVGYPIRMGLKCYDSNNKESISMKSLLVQELLKKGIFISPLGPIYMSYSHSKNDVDDTLLKLRDVCDSIMKNIQNDNFDEHVKGTIPKPIWAMKIPPTKKL